MKTNNPLTVSVLAILLSASISSFGHTLTDDPAKKPEQKASFAVAMFPANEQSKVWLCLEKYKSDDKIRIELRDAKGRMVFQEMLPAKGGRHNGFRQQFDLSDVEDGTYTFHISGGSQTEDITFKLSTPTLEQQLPTRLISLR